MLIGERVNNDDVFVKLLCYEGEEKMNEGSDLSSYS